MTSASSSFLLLLLVLHAVTCHYVDSGTKSMTILPKSGGVEKHTVSMKHNDGTITCVFQYETNPTQRTSAEQSVTVAKPTQPPAQGSVIARLEALNNQCVKSQVDYWAYEVCLGGGIRQYHLPDSYQLGTFSRWEGETQVYSNGAPCEARPDRQPRQVVVKFACSSGAPIFLASIRETQTCEYEAVVAAPVACDYPQFPIASGQAQAVAPNDGVQTEIPVNDGSEEWLLQVSALADGRYMCSAYSTETHSSRSELSFTQFGIHLNVGGTTDLSPNVRHHFVARQPGRASLKHDEVLYESGTDERFSTLANSDKFTGKLAYLQVLA